MAIVKADKYNLESYARLWQMLFSNHTFQEGIDECSQNLITKKEIGFLYEKDGNYIGFMNISIRHDYVNGTSHSPTAFIEAIYIEKPHRMSGHAKKFIIFAQQFARENNCCELASDCLITNIASEMFHKSCGFIEKERVICFSKTV